MIKKLLIANRGEIAVRIIRAARELGVRTIAVYSDADKESLHVALAEEAVHIGESEPIQSYLDADKIIKTAKETKADAIHPGYGFLSERASFSELCERNGLIFVGPPASAMRKLGAKIDAKKLAVENGVPITPGYFEQGATDKVLAQKAEEIGFPIMLKASAGGGGRGLRVVRNANVFQGEIQIARDEAKAGFGDDSMMVEKLIERPRHIEVQILADKHGNAAALFERECSIQRRHQKLIEESPSPLKNYKELWPKMRDAALKLVKASGYHNAGTVEFMVDESSGEFFFLEVNARLQVEHPVTEAVTAIDLVKWQIRIASGEKLSLSEDLINGQRSALNGHAVEVRVVAEDPAKGFLPSAGKILAWAEPKIPGVRIDTGYGPGTEIPRHYDSLLAKVIAHGENRSDALQKLQAALLDFHILGVPTNIGYLLDVMRHPDFREGSIDTGFLERGFATWKPQSDIPAELAAIASATGTEQRMATLGQPDEGAWALADDFRIGSRS